MQSTAWQVEKEGRWGWDALEVEAEAWEGKALELGLQVALGWGVGKELPDAGNGQAVRSGLG